MSIDRIRALIADSEVAAALALLVESAAAHGGELHDEAILLTSRFNALERELERGMLTSDAASARRAQITQAALRLSRRLDTAEPAPAPAPAHARGEVLARPAPIPPARATGARRARLFLASSYEVRDDRDALDLFIRQQNDHAGDRGLYIEVVRWENFLDAMSATRLQDEYNVAVRSADVFLSLFFTKTGKYTEEEFDQAYAQFKSTGRPLIYTYFKNGPIQTGSSNPDDLTSLWAFQKKLEKLGHYPTRYDNIDSLKLHVRGQLDRLPELLSSPRVG
jgi:hypothetical protein